MSWLFPMRSWKRAGRAGSPEPPRVTTGYLARYAKMVTSANRGAILEIPD